MINKKNILDKLISNRLVLKLSTTCGQSAKTPLISVVIPVFNREKMIEKTLQSVINQTFEDFEIIVVDDGSYDGTREILDRLSNSYPQKMLLIKQRNEGVSSARNAGIAGARGRYIAFCDSDDLWITTKLEEQIKVMQEKKWDVCQVEEVWIRNGKRVNSMKKHQKPSGDVFIPSLELCLVSPSATMLKKEVLNDVGLFDETLQACEDYDLWLRIALKYSIHLYEKPLIQKIGGHEDQLSKKFWGMDRFRIYALEKHLFADIPKHYKKALIKMLIKKSKILLKGFVKRKNWLRYGQYQLKIIKYQIVGKYYGVK